MSRPQAASRSTMGRLAVIATLCAVVVVMLGAWTRLVDAGLGCPDWPGCYGFLTVPESPAAVAIAEQRFPESPVVAAKGWPEMIHRYFATTLGVLILALAGYGLRHRKDPRTPVKLPLFLLFLVVLQGAFGMWTVTLKLWPQVVTAHLLGGFSTLALLFLLSLRLWLRPLDLVRDRWRLGRARSWLVVALLAVIVQIALGAWMASNYAAVACTELPTCQGQWWPEMDFEHGFNIFQHVGPNYLGGQLNNEGRVAIHMSHRIGAIVAAVLVLTALMSLWRASANTRLRRGTIASGCLLALQIALGLANIWLQLPVSVAVAHNAGGAALLLSLVYLLYCLHFSKAEARVRGETDDGAGPVHATAPAGASIPAEAYSKDGSIV